MQMSMRNCVTPKLTLTLTLTDTEGAVLTLMLGYRSLYITWQQHHNCRIVREFILRILLCILSRIFWIEISLFTYCTDNEFHPIRVCVVAALCNCNAIT